MRHGSLFSGIGGFDLAAQWMGWENVFHCEWMPFPRKILNYHFPNSISYEDITKTDFTIHRGTIDILTGGFPCQPYSQAGKRLGKEDERHLWPEMLRAIQEIEPTYVVGENVRGLVNWNGGLVFEEVCAQLENQGYEVQPILLPACSIGAPHRRDRIWFVAKNTKCNGLIQRELEQEGTKVWEQRNTCTRSSIGVCGETNERTSTNTKSSNASRNGFANSRWENNGEGHLTYSNSNGLERGISSNINTQEQSEGAYDEKRLSIHEHRIQFEKFPTQSPICGGDDGLPTNLDGITFSKWRQESIKGYGNAIVPQVAFEIFKAISSI